jgi:hypothetical protein
MLQGNIQQSTHSPSPKLAQASGDEDVFKASCDVSRESWQRSADLLPLALILIAEFNNPCLSESFPIVYRRSLERETEFPRPGCAVLSAERDA